MIDLQTIKDRHPPEHINALGSKDMQDIRDLIAEIDRLTAEVRALRKGIETQAKDEDCSHRRSDLYQILKDAPVSGSPKPFHMGHGEARHFHPDFDPDDSSQNQVESRFRRDSADAQGVPGLPIDKQNLPDSTATVESGRE